MSVDDALMQSGRFSISLIPETPYSILRTLLYGDSGEGAYLGHIVITPTPIELTIGDAAILSASRYTGRIERVEAAVGEGAEVSGTGPLSWLGDEQGQGPVLELGVTVTDSGFADAVNAVLNGIVKIDFDAAGNELAQTPVTSPITPGSITEPPHPAGILSNAFSAVTVRQALDYINGWFSGFVTAEYRVNPDFTIDAGPAYTLFPTNPKYSLLDFFHRTHVAPNLGIPDIGAGTWANLSGTWEIDSFRAHLDSATANAVARFDNTGVTNYILTVGMYMSLVAGGPNLGPAFRIEDNDNYLKVVCGDGTNHRITLQKRVAGVDTDLVSTGTGQWSTGTLIKLTIHAVNDLIHIYLNDIQILRYQLSAAEYTQFGDETGVGFWTHRGNDDDGSRFTFIALDDLTQRPTAIAVRRESGRSANITGIATRGLKLETDVEDYANRAAVITRIGSSALIVGYADTPTPTPYRDPNGNLVNIVALTDSAQAASGAPSDDFSLAANLAQTLGKVRKQVTIDSIEYDIEGIARPGDAVYIFDPERQLYDPKNQVLFQGEIVYPIIERLYQLSWPVLRGMGVYFRDRFGAYTDLTYWMEWEDEGGGLASGEEGPSLFEDIQRYEELIAASGTALQIGDFEVGPG